MPGTLYIVGTPIGNMEDITLHALRVLREADIIAAEDTRHTARLLTRHGITLGFPSPLGGSRVGETPLSSAAKGQGEGLPHRSSPPPEGRGVGSSPHPLTAHRSPPTARRLISYHQFNEAKRTPELLKALQDGRTVALVSDAGMPTISDPGHRLIQAVLNHNAAASPSSLVGRDRQARRSPPPEGPGVGDPEPATINHPPSTVSPTISIEIIPGPSAITAALVTSGFSSAGVSPVSSSSGFLFYGFLPHKSGQRRTALSRLAPLPYTLVFFESPYRLIKSLRDMHELLGKRNVVIARELTKKFEEIIRGDLATVLKKLENRTIKGEITVVVEGCKE
jgi:16S rRNA (cytidine1402-2'-O)-methyltransferase